MSSSFIEYFRYSKEIIMTFYERVETLRKNSGISQGALEKALGFSKCFLLLWFCLNVSVKTDRQIESRNRRIFSEGVLGTPRGAIAYRNHGYHQRRKRDSHESRFQHYGFRGRSFSLDLPQRSFSVVSVQPKITPQERCKPR